MTSSQLTPPFRLETLTADHPVRSFRCGTRPGAEDIERFLQERALAEQASGLSSVMLAIDPVAQENERIVGFFTLSPLSVALSPAVLTAMGLADAPYRTAGGYLLGRLGVSGERQGQGLGAVLVAAAIRVARRAKRETGGVFLAVDPKNDALLAWYEQLQFGFRRLDPARRRLVLPL